MVGAGLVSQVDGQFGSFGLAGLALLVTPPDARPVGGVTHLRPQFGSAGDLVIFAANRD